MLLKARSKILDFFEAKDFTEWKKIYGKKGDTQLYKSIRSLPK
jgi:hypothetical protein